MIDFFLNTNVEFFILAYLIGSIPFGLILAKQFANINIQKVGSYSIGATNVLRAVKQYDPVLAKKLGVATVVLDALKGAIVLLIAKSFGICIETLWGIAILAILGHCYSLYIGFEGGKGVATAFGGFLVLIPIPAIIGAIIWGICAKIFKISSISSLFGLSVTVIAALFLNNGVGVNSNAPVYIIAFIIFYKHIPNILRLISGNEKRVA